MVASHWTDERVAKLKVRLSEGWSAGVIGTELGISRNAVIGKIHRLGLAQSRNFPTLTKSTQRPKSARVLRRQEKQKPFLFKPSLVVPKPPTRFETRISDEKIPHAQRRTLLQLAPHECKWPVGDPAKPGFFFCGAPRLSDTARHPYCATHYRWAYVR